MKKVFILMMIYGPWLHAMAQEPMEKVMEKRAREMHRVIGLNDKDQWKNFIKENYTQALINKPMRATVQSDKGSAAAPAAEIKGDNLEAKATMFERLHDDFGGSKIISIKPTGEKLEMVLDIEGGLKAAIQLKFDKNKPYLIDGLVIQVGN